MHAVESDYLDVQGNVLDHDYEMRNGRQRVAEVSKQWFRLADTSSVEIAPGADEILILAGTVALAMLNQGREARAWLLQG